MSQLEVKEKELNKLKQESDQLVLNQHPASDKIEVSFGRFRSLLGKKGKRDQRLDKSFSGKDQIIF